MAIVAVAVTRCGGDGPTAPPVPVDARIVLARGETASVPAAGLTIRFDGVIGDSRCPADVVCIQGGDAIVRIEVIPDRGSPATFELHTGDMKPVRYVALTIALETLVPYPFSSRTIDPDEYRATLRVTR
jgi:hypothetical protein